MRTRCLQIMITEVCPFQCPDCALGMSILKTPAHMTIEQLEQAARITKGTIKELQITGGEPTCHPEFGYICSKLREWFSPTELSLCTNSILAEKWGEQAFAVFDYIDATHYAPPYSKDNTVQVEWLKSHYRGNLRYLDRRMQPSPHQPRATRTGKQMCEKGTLAPVSYWPNGLLYPCCVGKGINGAVGIPLTPNWVEEIDAVSRPCGDCFFAL